MHPPTTLPLRHKLSSNNLHDPPTPTTPHGFRAQINQLLPKHSYFRARVAIHQIDSVPFVNGLFSVRWRFKHVHSPPTQRQGLLGIVKTRSKNGDKRLPHHHHNHHHHHSGDDPDNSNPSLPVDPSLPSLLISSDGSSTTTSSGSARVPSFASTSTSSSASTGALSALAGAVYSITARSTQSETIAFSNYANASRSTLHLPPPSISPSPTTTSFPSIADPSFAHPPPPSSSFTPARGNTPYLYLKDHSVHWNQTLSTVIRLDVDRDTGSILPCPFKLVVMQRVRDNDPEIHRLGALYLNLSEYVGHGPVERRYLLRESKTNATLKLTIELEYISGETHYIPPPLPKGEILNGLSGYLEGELRTVTRGQTVVDIYGPYRDQDELEIDLFGTQCHSINSTIKTVTSSTTTRTRRIRYPIDDDDSDVEISVEDHDNKSLNNSSSAEHEALLPSSPQKEPTAASAFDVERLPIAYGIKTTETLIEAIFNPVRTSELRCESPFTVYVPPPPTPPPSAPSLPQRAKSGSNGGAPGAAAAATSEVESVYSTESSSSGSGSGSGGGGGSGAASTRAMSQSGRSRDSQSQYSHHSSSDTRSLRSTNGTGGGRVKDWWRKIGPSRPQTPLGR